MNTTLTVDDPLVDQEVTIVITLAAGKQARDERLALVSVGITGQPPVTKTGTFGQAPTLISQAWTAFGVQTQVAATHDAAEQRSAGQETESVDKTTDTAVPDTQETMPQPDSSTPDPQPDLSILF